MRKPTIKYKNICLFFAGMCFLLSAITAYMAHYADFSAQTITARWPYFFTETFDDETHPFESSPLWVGFFLLQASLLFILYSIFIRKKALVSRAETLSFVFIFSSLLIAYLYSSHAPHIKPYLISALILSGILFWIENRWTHNTLVRKKTEKALESPWNILAVGCLGIYLFLSKISWTDLNTLIWTRDYGKYFAFAIRQSNDILHGTLYSWNDQFSGGYPTFLDLRALGFLLLPFKFFGDFLGYKLLVISMYAGGPLLIGWSVYQHTRDKKTAGIAMWISLLLWISFFGDIFYWGTIPGMGAIIIFLLTTGFYASFIRQNNYFALSLVIISLGILFYLHPIFFFLTLCYYTAICIKDRKTIFAPSKKSFIILNAFALFLICLPLIILIVSYHSYIISTFLYKTTPLFCYRSLSDLLCYIPALFSLERFHWLLWVFLPLGILACRSSREHRHRYLFVFLTFFFFTALPYFFSYRAKFLIVIFLAYFFSVFISRLTKHFFAWITIILTALFFFIAAELKMPPIKEPNYFSAEFVQEIKNKKGLLIFENVSYCDPHRTAKPFSYVKPTRLPHIEAWLEHRTNQRFLSHCGEDAYPYFKFREGVIAEGTWDGIDITQVPLNEILAVLNKWGVQSIITFTPQTVSYMEKYPGNFTQTYKDKYFTIYDVKNRNISPYLSEQSQIIRQTAGPNRETLIIKNAHKNDLVILRRNYFPLWKVWYNNQRLKTFSHEGLLAFKLPESGEITITTQFPSLCWTLLIPLFTIPGLLIAAARKGKKR